MGFNSGFKELSKYITVHRPENVKKRSVFFTAEPYRCAGKTQHSNIIIDDKSVNFEIHA